MKNRLFGLLEPVAADLGYELLEVEFGSAGRDSLVRAFIDRTDGGGMTLDDCERVSRAIGAVLDALGFQASFVTMAVCGLLAMASLLIRPAPREAAPA